MTQEEKELLMGDLCARLPYGLIIQSSNSITGKLISIDIVHSKGIFVFFSLLKKSRTCEKIDYVKPYLRPMSSMTEKERAKYLQACDKETDDALAQPRYSGVDWLNEHHFDYRGLIPMGLALKAPENMYH